MATITPNTAPVLEPKGASAASPGKEPSPIASAAQTSISTAEGLSGSGTAVAPSQTTISTAIRSAKKKEKTLPDKDFEKIREGLKDLGFFSPKLINNSSLYDQGRGLTLEAFIQKLSTLDAPDPKLSLNRIGDEWTQGNSQAARVLLAAHLLKTKESTDPKEAYARARGILLQFGFANYQRNPTQVALILSIGLFLPSILFIAPGLIVANMWRKHLIKKYSGATPFQATIKILPVAQAKLKEVSLNKVREALISLSSQYDKDFSNALKALKTKEELDEVKTMITSYKNSLSQLKQKTGFIIDTGEIKDFTVINWMNLCSRSPFYDLPETSLNLTEKIFNSIYETRFPT